MIRLLAFVLSAAALAACAAEDPIGWRRPRPEPVKITADIIGGDNVTRTFSASGHVNAVSKPFSLRGDSVSRDAAGAFHFAAGTSLTTCTNGPGCEHWNMTGEMNFHDRKYISGRNLVLRFWEVPVLWLPYWHYPLDTEYGLRMMPGYTSRWGAYLLTKYVYHVAGDRTGNEELPSLKASTRLDLRTENGVAVGQGLRWSMGEYGKGRFKAYYVWDEDYDHYSRNWNRADKWNYRNWGSEVERDRYIFELGHRWEPSERDIIRLKGSLMSDSHFYRDFLRSSLFNIKSQWLGFNSNELAWEHIENFGGAGVSVSGPLNEFYGGTMRLPEAYFDIAPRPLWGLPVNYESESRAGYLRRDYARYGTEVNVFSYNPGAWANYGTFRMDTYHRLTAPFRIADVVSAVPRVAWRGTYWGEGGNAVFDGMQRAGRTDDDITRSIVEGGITFAARGTAWVNDRWRHMLEPYFDVLAQDASYHGEDGGERTFVFDSVDMSRSWDEQFAGRARNLPHSYVGVTPGLRNVWSRLGPDGRLENVFELDVYAALQFNDGEWYDQVVRGRRIARPGEPNYGQDDVTAAPGIRAKWTPGGGIMLGVRTEYDSENDDIALADMLFEHRLRRDFGYYAKVAWRNHRWWDYSLSPYSPDMEDDVLDDAHFGIAEVGFEHEISDAFVWSPFLSWDMQDGSLDEVGAWFDYRTDCLGFRFILSYSDEYRRIDGSTHDEDWSFGFFVYLRAFGPSGGDAFWK